MTKLKPLIVTLLAFAVLIGIGTTAVALNPGTDTTQGVVALQAKPTATSDRNKVVTVSTADLYQRTLIINANIDTTAAVAVSKLAAGTSAQFLQNNSTPTPTWTTWSGDVTLSNAGVSAVTKINGATAPSSPSSQTGYAIVASGDGAYALGDNRGQVNFSALAVGTGASTSTFLNSQSSLSNSQTIEGACQILMGRAGSIVAMYVHLDAALVTGHDVTFTVDKNKSGQAITCQILGTATDCSDTTSGHAFTFVAGDRLSIAEALTAADVTGSRPEVVLLIKYG